MTSLIILIIGLIAFCLSIQGWYYDVMNSDKVRSTICYIIAIILFIVIIFMVVR